MSFENKIVFFVIIVFGATKELRGAHPIKILEQKRAPYDLVERVNQACQSREQQDIPLKEAISGFADVNGLLHVFDQQPSYHKSSIPAIQQYREGLVGKREHLRDRVLDILIRQVNCITDPAELLRYTYFLKKSESDVAKQAGDGKEYRLERIKRAFKLLEAQQASIAKRTVMGVLENNDSAIGLDLQFRSLSAIITEQPRGKTAVPQIFSWDQLIARGVVKNISK